MPAVEIYTATWSEFADGSNLSRSPSLRLRFAEMAARSSTPCFTPQPRPKVPLMSSLQMHQELPVKLQGPMCPEASFWPVSEIESCVEIGSKSRRESKKLTRCDRFDI